MSELREGAPVASCSLFVVKGIYVKHSVKSGFRYLYECPECGRKFLSSCPELSAPSLCHPCYAGTRDCCGKKRRGFRA